MAETFAEMLIDALRKVTTRHDTICAVKLSSHTKGIRK